MVKALCSLEKILMIVTIITLWRASSSSPSSMEMVSKSTTKILKLEKSKWVSLLMVCHTRRILQKARMDTLNTVCISLIMQWVPLYSIIQVESHTVDNGKKTRLMVLVIKETFVIIPFTVVNLLNKRSRVLAN